MKRILRAAVGTLFFASLMLFLFVTALKFRVLNSDFWITALNKSGVYQQVSGELVKFREKMGVDVSKARRQGAPIPKEVDDLLAIDKTLSEARIKELLETNVKRIIAFVNKETEELTLFLPVKEWSLPVKAFGFVPFAEMTANTSLREVMNAITKVGLSKQTPEEVEKSVVDIKKLRNDLTAINLVWLGLLVVSLLLLAGHYFLGEGQVDRIGGTAWTVMLSGFLAKLTGFGSVFMVGVILAKSKLSPQVVLTIKSLASQFFALGEWIGFLLGLVGLCVIIAVSVMVKQKKSKPTEKKISFIKRWILFSIGVALGIGILLAPFVLVGASVFKSASAPYKSESGWSMVVPAGWEVVKDKESEGFIKKPSGSPTDWAAIEIKPLERTAEIDSGRHLETIKKGIPLVFKSAKIVSEPGEELTSGMKVFLVIYDYDAQIGGRTIRLRAAAAEFFPAKTGSGFLVIARVPVESWDSYERVMRSAVATFTLPK